MASGLRKILDTPLSNSFDPLRDEDILYGLKLLESGVPVELHTFPGTFHGSSLIANAKVSQRQQQEMLRVLTGALSITEAAVD